MKRSLKLVKFWEYKLGSGRYFRKTDVGDIEELDAKGKRQLLKKPTSLTHPSLSRRRATMYGFAGSDSENYRF